MAQLHRHPQPDTSKAPPPTIATVEQLLRAGGESSKVSPTSSSSAYFERSKQRDTEEDHVHGQHQKKSVLTKVKEKAKKLRHSLSKKKHDDGNVTPTMGEDEQDDEDTEYLGAPSNVALPFLCSKQLFSPIKENSNASCFPMVSVYESELAPEGYREKARQHPRAIPVISEKHVLPSSIKSGVERDQETPLSPSKSKTITTVEHHHPSGSDKTMTDYTANPSFTSKFQGLSIYKPTELHDSSSPSTPRKAKTASQTYYDASMPPRVVSAPLTPQNSLSDDPMGGGPSEQVWDKGVSVKEYLMNKFEPGEDERALSQVISEAMSPRRTPQDKGVMEKVKDAVSSFLRNDDPSQNTAAVVTTPTTSSSEIPVSTHAYEVVEDENKSRILQAN
ncbi:putative serine/threonine-protein kinase dyrk2 isoform X1 [Senna tora]|uniref:Putative serine/threonine-protein kinase dyrk2 isoform X1 n=1 Tax=Senna tora TaxID=362788 RepID=A0A834W1C4_9FABA|nr:putative serine/threonine-protein kinase dyrk2 isoform X1 [Senna tora]